MSKENELIKDLYTELGFFKDDLKMIDSPIERILYIALKKRLLSDVYTDGTVPYSLFIDPQEKVTLEGKDYKPDFRITMYQIIEINGVDILRDFTCYIECDGHEYHERTKEQAKNDRAKDRAFMRAGLNLLRFTGSEIYNTHFQCTNEIISFMYKNMIKKEFK